MTLLLSLLAGIVGCVIGWAGAAALTLLLGGYFGVSDFEGGRGMLAIWGIGPIGGLIGLVAGIALVLKKRGRFSLGAIAWRLPLVIAGIVALVAAGFWWMHETRPVLNTNGPAPRLAFEVRLPPGLAPTEGTKAELHTEKNKMPGLIAREAPRTDAGRAVLAGSVELYYRSGWLLLEVRVPGQHDRIFKLNLPSSPRRSTDMTRWQKADFIAEPGLTQPKKAGADEAFEIRYRVIWTE